MTLTNVKSVIDNEYGSGKSLIAAIASNMEITDDKARELLDILEMQNVLSLDELIESEEDVYVYVYAPDEYEEVLDSILSDQLMVMLDSLTEREKKVVELRYGLRCKRPYTLEEIGGIMGVTRERIRQIEDKALRKLRKIFSKSHSHMKLLLDD